MDSAVDRVMAAFTRTHLPMTEDQARTVRAEIAAVIAELLHVPDAQAEPAG